MAMIEVQGLHKRYRDQVAVHDVSFSVEQGEIFGILGPNGAGKTTTVECVGGLRKADGGHIRVLGLDPQHDRAALRARVGIQLQHSELPEQIKVWEALDLYSSLYADPARWQQLLDDVGLAPKRNTAFHKLSGGQKQRLLIALALVGNPQVAILDELTSGLDPQARRDTWQLIKNIRANGVTVLLVTHAMEEAERLCDRIAVIDHGRVVALDAPAAIVARAGAKQRLRFRPSTTFDARMLTVLPEVECVTHDGAVVVVAGNGNLVHAVTATLARHQIIAHDLRIEQATLDDAFVALTGRKLHIEGEGAQQ